MIQNNTTHKILPSTFQICITGTDPLQTRHLKEELSLRFRKRICMNVFKTEEGCINFINTSTDIVFFVGPMSVDGDYSEEISIRKKIRIKSPLADVFVLYNKAQKTEAMQFLYDITQIDSFWGVCRLNYRYLIKAPVNFMIAIFKRSLKILKPSVFNQLQIAK